MRTIRKEPIKHCTTKTRWGEDDIRETEDANFIVPNRVLGTRTKELVGKRQPANLINREPSQQATRLMIQIVDTTAEANVFCGVTRKI